MKNQIFEKKGELSFEKKIVAFSFAYYRTWKYPGSTFQKSLQGILTKIVQRISSFLWDLRGR